MATSQRRRHVWLVGVPVEREFAVMIADGTLEPTHSRLLDALDRDSVMAPLDRDDEERILRALTPDCPRELDELYRELLRRCGPSHAGRSP